MTAPIIRIDNMTKSFGAKPVLQGLDWQITPGKVIGLLGRNGAGKSTLLECMLGLQDVDRGSITLYGEGIDNLSDTVRARIAYVPQKSDLFEWLTPLQMLDYFKALYPHWNAGRVDALLTRWGFSTAKRCQTIASLSGGEKQRLSIIRALAHDPQLLILDEPVASLDPVGRRDFLHELIEDVIERETTVVFSTHILSDLERVALDIAFLKDGKIALQGEMDDLLENSRRIIGPPAVLAAMTIPGELRRATEPGGEASVTAYASASTLTGLASDAQGVRVERLSLEDLFIGVTQ